MPDLGLEIDQRVAELGINLESAVELAQGRQEFLAVPSVPRRGG